MAATSARLPEFEVFMWIYSTLYDHPEQKVQAAYQRFRDMGCTGGMVYAGQFQNYRKDRSLERHLADGFPFYVENLVPAMYTEWGRGKREFFRQYEEFGRTRDRKVFTKVPCLNDPQVLAEQSALVRTSMTELAPGRDFARYYDVRDEPSIGAFILANDTCFCDHCMRKMRAWLRDEVYGTLEALNAEWGTAFGSWDEVAPLTTEEIIERRRAGNYNFAPWCDHRTFMDKSFADFYLAMATIVKELAPGAPVGLEGTQCPCAFGGYDFSRFVPLLDWIEPYAFGGSMEAVRSFRKGPIAIFHTAGLGRDAAGLRNYFFDAALDAGGHAGAIIWQSEASVDMTPAVPRLTDRGRDLAGVMAFMRSGFTSLLTRATELTDGVALHYSQASIQACVPLQLPDRRRSWASFRQENTSLDCRTRNAWLELLYDLGVRPGMVSAAEVEAGALVDRKLKLLVLPWSLCLSEKEVAALEAFVRAGGVVVADSMPGRFDGRGKPYDGASPADRLFGIERGDPNDFYYQEQMLFWTKDLKGRDLRDRQRPRGDGVEDLLSPREGAFAIATTETTSTGAMFVHPLGKGLAVLLNVMPVGYSHSRLVGAGEVWRRVGAMCLAVARVRPRVTVARATEPNKHLPGWRTASFRHGKALLVGLVADLGLQQGTLGATETARGEEPGVPALIDLGREGHVYEATTGTYLGKGGRRLKDRLTLHDPRLYVVLPYKVRGMKAKARREGNQVAFEANLTASGPLGEHVFRAELVDRKGRVCLESGVSFLAPRGKCAAGVAVPKALKGAVTLRIRDVASGVAAVVKPAGG